MKTALAMAFASITMVACASVTDVVSTGPDTYMVAAEGVVGNSSSGKELVLAQEQAAAFCKKQGKQVETISTSETPSGFGKSASGRVNFRCIKP